MDNIKRWGCEAGKFGEGYSCTLNDILGVQQGAWSGEFKKRKGNHREKQRFSLMEFKSGIFQFGLSIYCDIVNLWFQFIETLLIDPSILRITFTSG